MAHQRTAGAQSVPAVPAPGAAAAAQAAAGSQPGWERPLTGLPAPPEATPGQVPRVAAGDDAPVIDAARLRLAIGRLARMLRRHQLAGLTPTQVAALSTVDRSGPLRLAELAAAEGVAPSTLTRLVAALEDRGYVERRAVAGDARASTLAITRRGHEVLDRIRRDSTTALAGSLALLRPDQLAALAAALPVLEQLAGSDQRDPGHAG